MVGDIWPTQKSETLQDIYWSSDDNSHDIASIEHKNVTVDNFDEWLYSDLSKFYLQTFIS